MAPAEYSLRLQKGITGGFAPPTPNAIYTLTRPLNQSTLNITSSIRPSGTPSLQDAAPKTLELSKDVSISSSSSSESSSAASAETLIDELHSILQGLPTESPVGSEDIYGLDTSIAWGSDDLMWCNGGPAGCGGGGSSVKASEDDKKKFRRAVEIVEGLVGGAA